MGLGPLRTPGVVHYLDTAAEKLTWDACRMFLDDLISSAWWHHRYVLPGGSFRGWVELRKHRRASGAFARPFLGTVHIPARGTTRWILLHELAHLLAWQSPISHGRDFAQVYLDLVGRWIGQDARLDLRASFVEFGVRYRGTDTAHLIRVDAKARRRRNRKAATDPTTFSLDRK